MLKIFMIKVLTRPIDKAILVYFRFMTGMLISQELINGLMLGKLQEYTLPQLHFSYLFFDWIKPWPLWGMVLHYGLTILAGFMVALGIYYRAATVVLFLGYTSLFLMEMSEYINHAYLYCLISFWMMFLPLGDNKKSTAPAWMLYLILFHMSLAYFFGGIAKLNSDWLMGTPMDLFLTARKDHLLGSFYTQSWAPLFFSYGGICFDLLIVPLMLLPWSRKFGLVCSLIFHLSNVLMFGLATFPWFSLVLTSMFFDPSWPRKVPGLRLLLPQKKRGKREYMSPLLVGALATYIFIHLALPFRHWLYPGNPSWTEEGHMFAWRMMLRSKSGNIHFSVQNKKTKQLVHVYARQFLSQRQFDDMVGNPDMILQFAHFLRDKYHRMWNTEVSVFASAQVSLNGRPKKELIRPGTDLAAVDRTLGSYDWIVPLKSESELLSTTP